jgi:GNAT superfamily N-acetyltransferase
MFVAELDGAVVGTVGMKIPQLDMKGHFAGLRREGDVEMVRMNVAPRHQGYGISKLLLDEAIQFAREEDYKRIVLTSSSLNPVATSILYPKYGFKLLKEASVRLGVKPLFMAREL